MVYMLRAHENVAEGLPRIVTEQVEQAIAAFSDKRLQRAEAVHQARLACKKIRALLWLARNKMSEAALPENDYVRGAAGKLARIREADALSEAFDEFKHHPVSKGVSRHVLREVGQVLEQRRQIFACDNNKSESLVKGFMDDMKAFIVCTRSWTVDIDGVPQVIVRFAKSHQRARRAMKLCRRTSTVEAYHNWRKWSKYQLYQSMLLKKHLKGEFKQRMDGLEQLCKLLGVDHDLAALRHEVVEAKDFCPIRQLTQVGGLLQAIDRRRKGIQRRSIQLGQRIYSKRLERSVC